MERKTIGNKSIIIETAVVVTAFATAVPAGKIIGGAIRQVVDNIMHGGNDKNG